MTDITLPAGQSSFTLPPVRPAQPPLDPALRMAWTRYLQYADAADRNKPRQSAVRSFIIFLSVFIVFLSIVSGLLAPVLRDYWLMNVLRFVLAALPLVYAGLLSWTIQFMPSTAWIAYRVGSELIRYNIFLYRTGTDRYVERLRAQAEQKLDTLPDIPFDPFTKRELLRTRVLEAIRRVNEMGVAEPYVGETIGEHELAERVARKLQEEIPVPEKPRRTLLDWLRNRPAPAAAPFEPPQQWDDGFSSIDVQQYIRYRVLSQREWYVNRLRRDWEKLKFWRAVALAYTALGSLLVFVGAEAWVALTTAGGVAVALMMDLRMYGRTFGIFHLTVSRIDDELARFANLVGYRRPDDNEDEKFIANVEQIFKEERDRWMEQATQAQLASEQGIIKNANLGNTPYDLATKTNADMHVDPQQRVRREEHDLVQGQASAVALPGAQAAAAFLRAEDDGVPIPSPADDSALDAPDSEDTRVHDATRPNAAAAASQHDMPLAMTPATLASTPEAPAAPPPAATHSNGHHGRTAARPTPAAAGDATPIPPLDLPDDPDTAG